MRPDPGAAVAGALAAAALQLISRLTEALAAKLPPRRPDAIAEIADPVTAQEVLSRQMTGVRAMATCRMLEVAAIVATAQHSNSLSVGYFSGRLWLRYSSFV